MWVTGALQNDKDLRDMIKHVCEVALPPQVAADALAFIEGSEDSGQLKVPSIDSIATMSRVRARVDVAWMLLTREWVMSRLLVGGGAGLRVYVQTDATWQAKQGYQVTVLNFVEMTNFVNLHKDHSPLFGGCEETSVLVNTFCDFSLTNF